MSANLPSGIKSRKLVQAALINSSAVLDGFVLEGAQGPALDISYKAGPLIKNCTINNNAIAATIYEQSAPFITNCNFNSNAAAVDINNSAPIIDSCSFKYNAAGAITNNNHGNAVIKNSRFVGNSSTKGGDIYNDLSSPQIINCYSDSAFASLGGSIANFNNSNPLITRCVFKNSQTAFDNSAYGGIVYNKDSKPYFLSCSFINSRGNSGAFYNLNSIVKLENCLGFGNQGGYHGAGFPGVCFMTNSGSTTDLLNCNILKSSGGNTVISNMDNSLLNIKNSILWDNNFNTAAPVNTYQPDIINTSSLINMTNSITRNYVTNGNNGNLVAVDPKFININDPAGKDGLYGTADDGLTLCTCSPAIDAGLAVVQMAATDITNSQRVFNGVPDIGAYEYQSAKINRSKTLFVSAAASGANDGSTWANAYTSLQSALKNTCADTIKMMEGVYKPAIKDRDSAFEINRKLYIAGGYQNIANPLDANRNPDKYPTILSGEIGNLNDTTDNSFTILKINNTDTLVKIDGLTFSNCFNDNITGNSIEAYGGAVYSKNNARLLVNNCRFTQNHSTYYYGPNSLRSLYSTIELSKNVFSKNYSVDGNTLQTDDGLFNNDIFSKNYSATGSDIIITGIADFKNCLFYKNFAGGQGAGVFNKGSSAFLNCDFIENTSLKYGAGLHNTGGAYLLNCIFNGNYTGNDIYADWYDYSGSPDGSSAYHQNPYTFDISYSSLQTSFPSPGFATIAGTEKFVDISNPIGPDNSWFTDDDGLKLLPCSPLVDGGTTTTSPILQSRNTLLPTTDITDSTRIKGVTIDLGAYEYPGYFNPLVTIKASDSSICAGSPVTFIATTRGFGDKPIFQWQVNGMATGINSDTLTTTLLKNNDSIKVFVTGDNACTTGVNGYSNIIKIKVSTTLIPSITISVPAVTICQNEAATFTATNENAGINPLYQWRVNDIITGTNSKTFTTSGLTNNAQVKVLLTSSLSCTMPNPVTSNVIAMTVVTAPIANAGADASVCAGGSIQLSGSGGNTYSWSQLPGLSNYDISNPVATPSTNTTYVLTVSNGNNCSSKDSVNITITQPATPLITINTASDTICLGSVTTFTASVTDGGVAPAIQWQLNGSNVGTNGNTFANNTLIDKDQVMATLTSNATCVIAATATSNLITITAQKLDTPNVSLNDKVLLLTNPDADATYTWQSYTNGTWSNVIPFATGTSYTVINSGQYRVMAVKGPCTAYSNSNTANFRSATTTNLYGIIVYPNPASKTIVLDSLKSSQHWASIDIVSAEGRPVLSKFNITNQNTVSINISGLINGIYFIKVKSLDDIVTAIKFIKF